MGEPIEKTENASFVFNTPEILDQLFHNNVPLELEGRLRYSYDSVPGGTTLEIYEDIETGDQFRSGELPTFPTVTVYRIVRTKVGEYKIFSYHGIEGYMGSEFFFNNQEIRSKYEFWDILKNQKEYKEIDLSI